MEMLEGVRYLWVGAALCAWAIVVRRRGFEGLLGGGACAGLGWLLEHKAELEPAKANAAALALFVVALIWLEQSCARQRRQIAQAGTMTSRIRDDQAAGAGRTRYR